MAFIAEPHENFIFHAFALITGYDYDALERPKTS